MKPRAAGTVLAVLALTNLVAYAARNSLFNVYKELHLKFGLGDADIGLLTTAFLLPHALATLPFGWAGDRYDRRRIIAIGMIIASIAGAAGALAPNAPTFVLSRVLLGLGTAAVVPVANSILGQIYEGPGKATRIAIFNLGVLFGAAAGYGLGLALGFPLVVVALAVPCFALALAVLALPVPPHPGHQSPSAPAGASGHFASLGRTFIAEARELLAIRTLRWIMLSTIAMAFSAGGYSAWLLPFLERHKNMSEPAANKVLAIAGCGAIVGVIVGGRLADAMRARLTNGRLWTMALGMTLSIPSAIACIELPPGPALYAAGIATFFFSFWYHAPMAVTVDDLAPPSKVVAAQGLVIFTMHLVGTAPSSWITGLISQAYSPYIAMWVPTVALAVAVLMMAMATRTFAADHARAKAGEPASASL